MQKGFEIDMFGYEPEFVVCGDARIAYYDVGRGKPLVLLHGNGEDSSYWNAQIPELTRFYRVIAVDSRGHGASGSGGHGLSFEMMAEDLKTVLDTLGVKKAHFLGFSDGGNLAIKFALTHPEYIDKLILNAANVEMFSGVKPPGAAARYGRLRCCCGAEPFQQKGGAPKGCARTDGAPVRGDDERSGAADHADPHHRR